MNDPIKILVVGCGSIGRRHLTALSLRRDVELAAHDPAAAAQQAVMQIAPDIRFFHDAPQALAWKPELVIVATPNHLHLPAALAAFDAGAHVLCEKPIADTVENGLHMVQAAKSARRRLMVGYTERYRPSFAFVQSLVKEGRLGTLVGGRAMVGTYNTILCSQAAAHNPMFGSLIIDYTHELDMLGSLFGQAVNVQAMANQLGSKPGIECRPSLAAMLIAYQSGAVASVHMDYIQHPQRRLLEVFGDQATAEIDLQTDTVRLFDAQRQGHETRRFPLSRNEVFALEHDDALQMTRQGLTPRVTGEQALAVLEVAQCVIACLSTAERGSSTGASPAGRWHP